MGLSGGSWQGSNKATVVRSPANTTGKESDTHANKGTATNNTSKGNSGKSPNHA